MAVEAEVVVVALATAVDADADAAAGSAESQVICNIVFNLLLLVLFSPPIVDNFEFFARCCISALRNNLSFSGSFKSDQACTSSNAIFRSSMQLNHSAFKYASVSSKASTLFNLIKTTSSRLCKEDIFLYLLFPTITKAAAHRGNNE